MPPSVPEGRRKASEGGTEGEGGRGRKEEEEEEASNATYYGWNRGDEGEGEEAGGKKEEGRRRTGRKRVAWHAGYQEAWHAGEHRCLFTAMQKAIPKQAAAL